jgi:hypothetical protein
MAIALDVLEAEVLGLSVLQRSHLLDRLISSLDADPEIQQAWAVEAERRDAEIDAGKVALASGPAVVERLRATL